MKITGIIAEYNPFHKGHAYHLQKAREYTGADYVVAVQSGNFVQRGEPALADKYCRARMALLEGADLVLELPCAYACASAEGFAGGAVALLHGLGCVDALCFGSECGDLSLLRSYADVLADEPEGYQELLRAFLKQGNSFPSARSKALHEYLSYTQDIVPCSLYDQDCRYESEILSQPNNTLGIEYLKALKLSNSSMEPVTILRRSAGYHEESLDAEFASATAIRCVFGQTESPCIDPFAYTQHQFARIRHQLPPKAAPVLQAYLEQKLPLNLDDFSSILYYRLLSLSEEELASHTDVSPELASRMKKLLNQYRSASSFADLLKTKQLTHTRITRSLCHILLKDLQKDADHRKALGYPVYGRILGFRKDSQPLLSTIKQSASIPILAKAADGTDLLREQPELLSLFEQDLFCAHVYEAAAAQKSKTAICHEYTRQIAVIE